MHHPGFTSPIFNDRVENILPKDGNASYYTSVFSPKQSFSFFQSLLENIEWQNDELTIYGKKIITKRKTAWYGERPFTYTYSHSTKIALPWTSELKEIKSKIELISGHSFNSCLLNLYHDGNEGMSWHSDNEKEIVRNSPIASISFGAEMKFSFKHKTTKETISLTLGNGSLLMMEGETQRHWLHSLPKSKIISEPRINLTFRSMIEN